MSTVPFEKTPPGGVAMPDEEVVRRVVAGDTALFEVLMRRYNVRVYRAVRAILRDESEVEEVMQQAYLNAFTHLGQFEQRAQFSTWLTRIAVNEALARRKKRPGRGVLAAVEEPMEDLVSHEPSPEQQAMTSNLRAALEEAVGELDESYRTVFVLREVEGLSTAEAAEALSVSEEVVKTRLHRARAMLRRSLFQKAGQPVQALFPFDAVRCDRVVAAVLARLAE